MNIFTHELKTTYKKIQNQFFFMTKSMALSDMNLRPQEDLKSLLHNMFVPHGQPCGW